MIRKVAILALLAFGLAACQAQAPRMGDGENVLPVAAVMEFNFDHKGAIYPIRLEDSLAGVAGDVEVFGYNEVSEFGSETRLTEVAEAACVAQGRVFDANVAPQIEASAGSITFPGACL